MSAARAAAARRRAGFTATEVVVAVAVLAIAVLPVFMSTTAGNRTIRLTEYHVIAQARAKRLLEAYTTFSLAELREKAPAGGELPPPFTSDELDGAEFSLPAEYRGKMQNFSETGRFEDLSPDLGVVRVEVKWTVNGKESDYRLFRFVGGGTPATTAKPSLGGGP